MPPTSNPAEIYENLKASVERPDFHCPTIVRVQLSLKERALEWVKDGSLTYNDAQDIIYQLDHAAITDWRPLLYVVQSKRGEPPCRGAAGQARESNFDGVDACRPRTS
jgi:hypothetical protein